ncbi:unnamed protein product [Brachionus calyciflorus]|uniref:Tc1-like transposase DDE domain-containing protein n=1 Tax=Brachionus calyciflorus TaxID=104777 RepID=A0A814MUE4_9BILA|nr:unnamed protein product [Brachionus calyciflorus]
MLILEFYFKFPRDTKQTFPKISDLAKAHGYKASSKTIQKLVKRYLITGKVGSKISEKRNLKKRSLSDKEIKAINDYVLRYRDISSQKIVEKLGLCCSARTVRRILNQIGWKYLKTRYCQMVNQKNQIERFYFACFCKYTFETFDDVIFIDETTIEVAGHSRKRWHNRIAGETGKIHHFGGISRKGKIECVAFQGILDSEKFQHLLNISVIPFVKANYPFSHRIYMDNDPKHTSESTRTFLKNSCLNLLTAPPQSPDINVIETVWANLKYNLFTYEKPQSKEQLVNSAIKFWNEKVTFEFCNRLIDKISKKVIPKIIELKGKASGY